MIKEPVRVPKRFCFHLDLVSERIFFLTADYWPLCFHCGEGGHVCRHCPYRVAGHDVPEEDEDMAFIGVLDTATIARQQRADSELIPLIDFLEGRITSAPKTFARSLPSFCFCNGVLYKKNFSSNGSSHLLVGPTSIRHEVLQACHDEPTSGHLGYTRTLARVKDKYYWPRIVAFVKHYVRMYLDCQRRKPPHLKSGGPLQPVQVPTMPFAQIGMNLLGPFQISNTGNKWVIVATDYLTRYAETKALPGGTAVEAARFFIENAVLRHGAPTVIITTRGTAFTTTHLKTVLSLSGTAHGKTTAHHPQTNGLTERLNKAIADILSMYTREQNKPGHASGGRNQIKLHRRAI